MPATTKLAVPPLLPAALLAVLLAAAAPARAADAPRLDCPPFPLPDAKLTWIAPNIVYNSMPMQIRQFDSRESPQAILAYYRREWRGTQKQPGAIEYPLEDWQVIATLRGQCFYTVQVKPSGRDGSTGLLGMSRIPEENQVREAGRHFPMMSGSQVLNDIDHHDEGKRGRTLVLTNGFSPDANADFYRRVLSAEGWRVVSSHTMPVGNRNAYVLTLKRGLNETSMTIARNGEFTSVLVNLVDRP